MPPPYRPISDARRAFLDEPPAPRYFAPGPFDSQQEMGLQASSAMAADDLFSSRDEASTKAAENAFRRLSAASRARMMPYSEAANIAQESFIPEQIASQRRLLPGQEALQQTQNYYNTERGKYALQDLPEDYADKIDERRFEAQKRDSARADQEYRDPVADRLARLHGFKPEDIAVYEQLQDHPNAPKDPRQRQEWARDQALLMRRQQEAVAAADWLAHEQDSATGKPRDEKAMDLVENVVDASGNLIGQRIKKGADPQKVADAILSYRRSQKRKLDDTELRRQFQAESQTLNQQFDNISNQIREYLIQQKQELDPATLKSIAEEMEILRKQRTDVGRDLENLRRRHFPSASKEEGQAPVKEAVKPLPKGASYIKDATQISQKE